MLDVKPEVYRALCRALSEDSVFFVAPEEAARLPCISYLELNNVPEGLGDDGEYSSTVEIAVDIWGDTSVQVDAAAQAVDREMTAEGFMRTYATDIPPDGGNLCHKNRRYTITI